MRKLILHAESDYQDPRFTTLRLAEKATFAKRQENEVEFTGQDVFEGFGMARKAAMVYAGLLTTSGMATTVPYVADMGPYQGYVVGRQSPDGKQGWRIDWNPRTGEFHVNWWDRRLDPSPKGDRDKSKHVYGANYVTGGTQALFWELMSHFPGQVAPSR